MKSMTGMQGRALDRETPEGMRREFDRLFTAPHAGAPPGLESFIAIRVGGDRFAVRLAELAGLEARRKLTPLPGGDISLLGLAGIRGRLVAVYDLAALLGYGAAGQDAWRWIGWCRAGGQLVGLAFDQLEEFIRSTSSDVHAVAGTARLKETREHIHEVLSLPQEGDGQVHGVVSVASILGAIARRARPAESREELRAHGNKGT